MDAKLTLKEVKERFVDGNLDLSLSSLTEDEIPIEHMRKLTKITELDLCCNVMSSLPVELCTFTTIKTLDLSKNMITALPEEFGQLKSLKRLDLLGNELKTLPESFGNLKALAWLDLKENPLNHDLQQQVGDCSDEVQCKRCAKHIVKLMADVHEHRSKQRQLAKETADREAQEKAAQEALQRKREKEELKEKRRKDYEALLTQKAAARREEDSHGGVGDGNKESVNSAGSSLRGSPAIGLSTFSVVLISIIAFLSCLIGLYFYCNSNPTNEMCGTPVVQEIRSLMQYIVSSVQQRIESFRWLLEQLYNENINSGTFKLNRPKPQQ